MSGTLSAFTLSPRRPSMAGSSVSDMMTEMRTTMMAPAPRLRKMVEGMRSMPKRARTTVMPLKKTARLAVAPAAATASSFSRPRLRSSR